ncbi:hypothetical protein F4861DRAFT_89113 [Xylaria intraflava]|nr:hypothetical protein F4861DRAFT_89113 [Xylaria intraflava]
MGSINKQISRYETTAVYTHPDAKVDIILVHGLNGDPQKTWTAKNGTFWPVDLLPASLRGARANVLVYGYNADVYSKKHGSSPSDNFIFMHAQTLITSLTHYRKDELTFSNPIIWVCHSLGGILVKRALLYSNDLRASQHEDYRSIYASTYGIVFLGTPHTGSDIATWGTVLQAMSDAVVPRSFFQSESVLLKTLKRDNETLQNINVHFLDIYQRFKILMAHENHKTDLKGTKMLVVDANSAGPQLPGVTYYAVEATHSGMCKFDSKNAPGYRTISTAIREWVSDAPDVIATRWRIEEEDKLARAKQEIEERMKPWIQSQRLNANQGTSTPQQNNETILSPTQEQSKIQHPSRPLLPEPETPIQSEDDEELFPSQQFRSGNNSTQDLVFVKPPVFRPNTYFRGREKELELLHKMLMDRKRRSVGTSSVLIQSMPGGGKSHLARQYVFQHRYDYPGGIFWIKARSLQELEYGYYDIAKVAGLSEVTVTEQGQSDPTRAVVEAVQAWLSSTNNWLLILDDIHFDFEGLQHFIPFAKSTSIIYTSTERTMGEEYQFDNPQVIALDPFTKKEAQELLFEEMGKKAPYTQDDLQRAGELVELMDRLPLMIHVAALQLKATREPLAKYLRSYKSRPKAGSLPAYHAVCEQLEHRGAFAALNLMSLLAFFDTQIPVEMIGLGAKALDKRTPVKSKGPESRRGSLNLTFSILIAFALIERNEAGEASSETTQSTRSVDMTQDNLDVLKIRGIVQAFFVGYLDERHEVDFWLERAICVFCGAFDASIHRVDRDSQIGIPDDYRRFLIHGRRLLCHLDRFEKRFRDLNSCRGDLESRIDSIQSRIDQLNKKVSEAASQKSADVLVSVFERTNSLSESETSPSNPSLADYSTNYGIETLDSPALYSPTEQGPYHWHVPVDHLHGHNEWETAGSRTPQPPAAEIFDSMSMPDDDETTRKVFGPHHRTIRKHAGRRYREHAGAWSSSPQIVSDPRVTISRETAKGVINQSMAPKQGQPFSSTDSGPSVQSEAEISLGQITKGAPKPPGGLLDLTQQDGPPDRPKRLVGSISYANARAAVKEEEIPVTPTFSYPPPTFKDAAATIMRLKETDRSVSVDSLASTKTPSPPVAAPREPDRIPLLDPHTGGDIFEEDLAASLETLKILPAPLSRAPSGPPSRPTSVVLSRSTRSSPSQPTLPFPPPISIEVNAASSLRSIPSANSPHVSTHRISGHSIWEDEGYSPSIAAMAPMMSPIIPFANLPYPNNVSTPPKPFGVPSPPSPSALPSSGPSNLHPEGYSSQPMSRNTSHQSNSSIGSNHSLPQALGSLSNASNQALSSSPASQIMQQPRARCPSVVETEPSPRLSPFELDAAVSNYQLRRDTGDAAAATSKHRFRGRKRDRTPSTETASAAGSKSRFLSRIRSLRTRSESRRRTRSDSIRGEPGTQVPQDEPVSGRSPPEQAKAGEDMRRTVSGPGGIKLAEDAVIEFGSPLARAAAVIAEVRRRSPRLSGSSPLAARRSGHPGGPGASLLSTGGSPPRGVGLGIQQGDS